MPKVPRRLERLMPKFLDHQKKNAENLVRSLNEKNFAEVARIGHIIKGSAGSYGFDDMTDIGNAIESAAHAQDFSRMELEVRRYCDYVKEIKFEFVD